MVDFWGRIQPPKHPLPLSRCGSFHTRIKRTVVQPKNVTVSLVWLRRDLRLSDNPALAQAIADGRPILFLFHLDSERLGRHDVDGTHIQWELDCLDRLRHDIENRGGIVLFRFGHVLNSLNELNAEHNLHTIYGNEESGLQWSWERDKLVAKWCQENDVNFEEFPSNGVVRRLRSRDDWKTLRDRRIDAPIIEAPQRISSVKTLHSDLIPHATTFGLEVRELQYRPEPGETAAMDTLFSFLDERGRGYRKGMSSPISGASMCSRLSPYLSSGCITIRQIFYHTKRKQRRIKINPRSAENRGWSGSLSSYQSRLAWHCHFMQRLEAEATLDEQAMNPELDALLVRPYDEEKFLAWANGTTGWPFFDACMRSLRATGWINFRMRAMMQSVASYTLWLPWRVTGAHLARQFLDYEPGIHWSQIQMQSGVTGINSVRAYSILKQSKDQDPDGKFIKRWVPELKDVPLEHIHEPRLMSQEEQNDVFCVIGIDYPEPIVDEKVTRKEGISQAYKAKADAEAKLRSKMVYLVHGSRKRSRFQQASHQK